MRVMTPELNAQQQQPPQLLLFPFRVLLRVCPFRNKEGISKLYMYGMGMT